MRTSWMAAMALSLALTATSSIAEEAVKTSTTTADADVAKANVLMDEYWERTVSDYPNYATLYFGDHRFDDRLKDESAVAVNRRKSFGADLRSRLAKLDESNLPEQVRTSISILRFRLDRMAEIEARFGSLPFGAYDPWAPVTQMEGIQLDLPQLAVAASFANVHDYESYLKRLDAVRVSIDDTILRMETAIAAGWIPARSAIQGVPKQLEAQLVEDPTKSPEYVPFESFPGDISVAERERLSTAAQRVIRDGVVPAFRKLKTFYESRYLPAARTELGASSLPAGPSFYQAMLNWNTTTDLTAKQIHELGLREVARIGAKMDAVVQATGFKGTTAEFRKFVSSDSQFFYTKPDDMLAGYRDIAKRADAELPKFFAVLPRLTYGIRPMRPEEGNNAEHYTPGSAESGRAGYFEANVNDLSTRPKWTMETLLLHEAVPGHHLQTARAAELTDLPKFRRFAWFTAFGEGWALYSESLGDEMGFYKDPYQKFGNLSFEMLRACRLVVDTGIHAFGWSRERAIDYVVSNTGLTTADVTAEVDRYIVWPGQATAYKVGELTIKALRGKAKAELGDQFDLRRFHNAVIDGGGMPLEVLKRQIDLWIAVEKASKK